MISFNTFSKLNYVLINEINFCNNFSIFIINYIRIWWKLFQNFLLDFIMLYTWDCFLFLKDDCCSKTTRLLQDNNCKNVCYFRTTRLLNEEALRMYIVHEQQDLINHAIFVCFIIIITNLFDQTEKTFSDQLMMFVLTSLLTKLLNFLSLLSL